MTIEEEIIKEYEKKLIYAWSKANTKSKKKRLMYDLASFSMLSSLYPRIAKEYNWEGNKSYLELFEDENILFLNNVMANKEIFLPTFENVINMFKIIDFPFYKDYKKKDRKLTDKESQEIMFSFLNEYNPNMLRKYMELIKEGKLFQNNPLGSSALFCSLDTLNEGFIYPITDIENSIYKSSLLAHEIGHYFEVETFYQTKCNNFRRLVNTLPFYEVFSRTFEYAYLRYLIENNIYIEDTKLTLRKYYIDLLINSFDINLIYKLKNININEHNCIELNDEKVIEYANKIMDELNFANLYTEKGDMFDFKGSFVYGIGNLFSIYMYESYKNAPNNYRKEVRNTILNYPYTEGISAFERVGIIPDVLIKGDILKKELIKSR